MTGPALTFIILKTERKYWIFTNITIEGHPALDNKPFRAILDGNDISTGPPNPCS